MKVFLRILYVFLLVYIGINVYNQALLEKDETFFEKEVLEKSSVIEKDLFINNMLVLNNATKYINEPILKLNNKDEYGFDLEMYHYKTKEEYGIAIFLFNINYETNLENIEISILSNASNNFIIKEQNFKYKNITLNKNLIHNFTITSNSFNYNDKNLTHIKEIEIYNKDLLLSKIEHNESASLFNEANFTNKNDALINKDFNGNINEYQNLKEYYNDNHKITETNNKVLKSYNNIITKRVLGYTLMALIATTLVFFMEPIIRFVRKIFKTK